MNKNKLYSQDYLRKKSKYIEYALFLLIVINNTVISAITEVPIILNKELNNRKHCYNNNYN